MSSDPTNIYEAEGNEFTEENERLSSFDLPTNVSIGAISPLSQGESVLDVGAGPNTSLLSYVKSQGGIYTALDKRTDFLDTQKEAGAIVVKADARSIPLRGGSFDVVHARFVISHLGNEKRKSIKEMLRLTEPNGRAIFLDYDWTTARGSDAFETVKEFMINGGFLFDADFGSELEDEVRGVGVPGKVKRVNHEATPMTDYSQVLKLRQAGTTDLEMQRKAEAARNWNKILDDLQKEADSNKPPGFDFPAS